MAVTLQIQTVIDQNEKAIVLRALDSLANAVRVNRETTKELSDVILCCGDVSAKRTFTDLEVVELQSRFRDWFVFRYTCFEKEMGIALSHNRLGEACSSDYIMLMLPDAIVCPRLFSGMLEFLLDSSKNAGMVEARQTPIEHPKAYCRETLETEWATTACAMFPAQVFKQVRGFDAETFGSYCNDIDLSWRIRLAGKKIYYRPDCVVFHAKRLPENGVLRSANDEEYLSRTTGLLMAYKWSNTALFEAMYGEFSNGDADALRAVAHFDEMKASGALPERLDPEGKVARFVGGDYTDHRFVL